MLLESLLHNLPFVDGNKRVAFALADVFLRSNGYGITATSEFIYATTIELVENKPLDVEHLVP